MKFPEPMKAEGEGGSRPVCAMRADGSVWNASFLQANRVSSVEVLMISS